MQWKSIVTKDTDENACYCDQSLGYMHLTTANYRQTSWYHPSSNSMTKLLKFFLLFSAHFYGNIFLKSWLIVANEVFFVFILTISCV